MSEETITADEVLDAKGLNCPLPILKAKKALKSMEDGKILEIASTDPGSIKDFEAFAKATGNPLIKHWMDGDVYMFLLKRVV
ncbi:MAG TPA: sulfurtransferase TusA family protein [Hellea balneolensis]|uniref:Sulfurtransferase TusA family protein n=1 Tax=Hellea balneolensis TaxID=287478 RepID=A0A7C3C9M4_9PROT|nr:sulfurtransferase TusA family protein [Hellea balneolensis]